MDLNALLDIPKFDMKRFIERCVSYSLIGPHKVLSQREDIKINKKIDSEFAFLIILVFCLHDFKQEDVHFVLNDEKFTHYQFLSHPIFSEISDAANYLPFLKAVEKDLLIFLRAHYSSYNLLKLLQKYKEDKDLTDLFLYVNQNFPETQVLDFLSKTHHYSVKNIT